MSKGYVVRLADGVPVYFGRTDAGTKAAELLADTETYGFVHEGDETAPALAEAMKPPAPGPKAVLAAVRYGHETKPLLVPTSATGIATDVTLDMARDARRTLTEIKECFNGGLMTSTIFKDYVGVFQTLTEAQFTVLWASAAARVAAAYGREAVIAAAIDADEAYDIDAGWPD